ncbi:MAG: restriction endonuclease [Planctomycetaceae bacterium]|nr:MAG: restriction endonuclease [Planctomycetaceae bacterium]
MNHWTQLSCDYANQRNYLDELFRVYPMAPEGVREPCEEAWNDVESAFKRKDNVALFKALLKMHVFPLKDSYVAYLRRDNTAIDRNPNTIARLCGRIYQLGLNDIYRLCTAPAETNRQIGPLFRNWLRKGELGAKVITVSEFDKKNGNQIIMGSDAELLHAASELCGYEGAKGLDLLAYFNGKFIIGEAKFLTDFGGHQNAQFADAVAVLNNAPASLISVAILDGVLYIPGNHKFRKHMAAKPKHTILSALVLREFLYQV